MPNPAHAQNSVFPVFDEVTF